MVPLIMTYLHCLQHSLFEHLFYLFYIQITKLLAGHDYAVRSCCDLDLQGSSLNVALDTLSQYGDYSCEIVFLNRLQITKVWAGYDYAERS